jgi:hypothetical protein
MFTAYLLPDKSPPSTLNFAHVTCVAPAAKVSGGWQNRSDLRFWNFPFLALPKR